MSHGLVMNNRLYLLRRKRRGNILHRACGDLLVMILACWSMFGVARVFIIFSS